MMKCPLDLGEMSADDLEFVVVNKEDTRNREEAYVGGVRIGTSDRVEGLMGPPECTQRWSVQCLEDSL